MKENGDRLTARGRVPDCIEDFFKNKGGHSLLVRGAAGTGKTTLALEILKYHGEANGKYISSRTEKETVLEQFPWLNEDHGKKAKNINFKREKLNSLEGLVEDGLIDGEKEYGRETPRVEGGAIIMEIAESLPEMEEAYSFVEERHPQKTLLIFDSIDGLSEKYGIGKARLMRTVQNDIVEGSKSNVIFILEQISATPLDYLGDGVIDLSLNIQEGRIARHMRVEKMRGVAIKRPTYMYSLSGARFLAPPPASETQLMRGFLPHSVEANKHQHEVSGGTRSSLSSTLEHMLGGNTFGGGINLIRGDSNADILKTVVETSIVEKAVIEGWGIAWVPSRRCDTVPEERLSPSVASGVDSSRLRIFEVPVTVPSRFTAPLAGDDIYKEMGPPRLETYLGRTRGPYVYVLDIASLTTVVARGDWKTARSQMSFFLSLLATGGHTVFCFMSGNSPFLPVVQEAARTEIVVQRENGCYIICGDKPFTTNYLAFTDDAGDIIINAME